MNILFFGHTKSIFIKELISNLRENNSYKFFVFDFLSGIIYDVNSAKNIFEIPALPKRKGLFGKIFIGQRMRKMAKCLKESGLRFDACHIHYMDARYFFMRKTIFGLSKNIIISIYGSDFATYGKYSKFHLPFYRIAKSITFTNQQLADDFNNYFEKEFSEKIRICRFGLPLLEVIREKSLNGEKEKIINSWALPSGKTIIVVGYSSNPNSKHLEIINEISKTTDSIKENLFLIFPMTYGGYVHQISQVREQMKKENIEFLLLEEYLSNDKLAELRMISDIMVHLPENDQLSGAMQETLFAGNIVITGEWLPYNVFDELGIYYHKVKSVSELKNALPEIIEILDSEKMKASKNQAIIWELSSWERNIEVWNKLYSEIL